MKSQLTVSVVVSAVAPRGFYSFRGNAGMSSIALSPSLPSAPLAPSAPPSLPHVAPASLSQWSIV